MSKEIENMARDLAAGGYSPSTQSRYLKEAKVLVERFGREPSELSRDDLRMFFDESRQAGKTTSWLTNQICALRFLYKRTLGRPELVSFLRLPRPYLAVPVVLSLKEVQALLNAIRHPRYQAIAMVMYGSGLRISEALALETNDIDGERGVIRVRHGKGNKAREAKLSPDLYLWLRDYWTRCQPAPPHLFASSTGKLPTTRTIRKALTAAAQAAWIKKKVTPHVLRHSFATHLLEQGVDVHVVGVLLGHASLTSTVRYARVTRKIVRQTPSPLDLLPQRRL